VLKCSPIRKVLTALYALIEQKSALLKIEDLKAFGFVVIFVLLFCRWADAHQRKKDEKRRNTRL
jgi:hypothetical protein